MFAAGDPRSTLKDEAATGLLFAAVSADLF
jgi:hypothetical protein